MVGPEIEYNREQKGLEGILQTVDRPGDFLVAGSVEAVMPKMSVDRVGTVAFPILEAQARSLADAAERAPYGRGPDTVLDTSVRDRWQIDANRVHLSGAGWGRTIRSVLESVADGLGCHREALSAQLYKLLVYERGGFFAEHRDTEKVDGMIATLVVALPTAGTGGDLVIRHLDREATVNLQVDEPDELSYAAFYADCVHQTKPVESGHRVSLVFNVIMKPGAGPVLAKTPDYSKHVNGISEILSEWTATGQGPRKIVWLLDHEYSAAGLSRVSLKGLDGAVGQILALAAERAGCVLHSATLSIHESCLPDSFDIDEYGRQVDYTGRECSIEEVFDGSRTLACWAEPDLTGSELPEIPLFDEEALPDGCLDDAEPDEQTLFEASGNEGVSLERAYRLAAFVLWPRSKEVSVIAGGSIEAAIEYAERMLGKGTANCDASATRAELVSQLIDSWPDPRPPVYLMSSLARKDLGIERMLRLLSRVSDEEQSARFLCEVVSVHYGEHMNDTLVGFLAERRAATLGRFFPALIKARGRLRLAGPLALVVRLCTIELGRDGSNLRQVLRSAVRAVLAALPEELAPPLPEGEPEWRRPTPQALDADAVRDLFAASHRLELHSEAESAAALVCRHTEEVDPYRTLPKALSELCRTDPEFGRSAAFASLWHHSSSYLLDRSAAPPTAPSDQRIEAPIPCRCAYCQELRNFCLDPNAQTKRFRAVAHHRAHIEHSIGQGNLDMEFRTETAGRPYTLVCKKVPKSYLRRVDVHAADVKHMRILTQAAPSDKSPETMRALTQISHALMRK